MADEDLDYTYSVKIVDGKAVYTKVPKEGRTETLKPVTKSKLNVGCRGRYNAYLKKREGRTTIGLEKWAQINC